MFVSSGHPKMAQKCFMIYLAQQQQQLQQLEVELSQLKEASSIEYALCRPVVIVVRAWLRGPTYIGCHSGKKVVTGLSGWVPVCYAWLTKVG